MTKWLAVWACLALSGGLVQSRQPQARPSGTIVEVSSVAQLQSAVARLTSGTTIRVARGRYPLTQELRIGNGVTNVALVGATGNRADVVIVGNGMATEGVNIAVKVENAQDVRIADLSIGEIRWHPIQLKGENGAERVRISNVRLFDAGQQFIKSTVDAKAPNGVDGVIVENSLIEFTKMGPADGYTEGIDAHHGANWTIRRNVFRNIRVPATATYKNRPAILMWSGSRDTTVHGNTFINCERAIIFGQGGQSAYQHSHSGGAIFNNFIYRTERANADAGISIWDSPGTRVFHNTVIQNGTYPTAIEYRFATTTGVEIVNNLTDGAILQRNGASGQVRNNYTAATPAFFVNAPAGDLHLVASAKAAIDRGVPVIGAIDDFDGDTRPGGAAPDLGADEWRAQGGGLSRQTWTVEGTQRSALVWTPGRDANLPLVFVFHGHGGTSANAARTFRIHEEWPQALVIYPQGVPTVGQVTDPEGRLPGWQHRPGAEKDRDLKFFDTMLAWAGETYAVDPARTFAAGHSNGGSMVYALWAARGDKLAGVAPSSSVFRADVITRAKPKPVFIVAGRKDALVPFAAQTRSLQGVLRLNQAERTAQPWAGGAARHASPIKADVIAYIHAGGHQMPADSGALIVRFFKDIIAR